MSDPWAINAGKASTAIGTATIESDDNLLTIAAHGLGDGDTVTVDTLTGGGSALTADAVYFVRDATTDDFALSLTLNGPQVEFATDGGADVYHFAPQYTAAELRRIDAGLMYPDTGDRFGARQGVMAMLSDETVVQVSGSTWTTRDLVAVVYPGLSSQSGAYRVAHPGDTGSLDPADGANDRIDALDFQVQDDDEDSSGFRRGRIVYVAGTPGSGVRGSATPNSVELGTIEVLAADAGTSVLSQPHLTVARGGVLPVRDDTEGPDAGRYHGMVRYRRDTDAMEVWDGSAWRPIASTGGWETIYAAEPIAHQTNLAIPSGTYDLIRIYARGTVGVTGALLGLRVNADATAGLHRFGWETRDLDGSGTLVDGADGATTVWRLARWASTVSQTNTAECLLFNTHVSSQISYISDGHEAASTPKRTTASGQLTADRLLTSIQFFEPGSNSITAVVWIEGRRV